MLTNQSQVTLERLVILEQSDGMDLIVFPIEIKFEKYDNQRQWTLIASVYGKINRRTSKVIQYEEPTLDQFSLLDLGFQSYLEVELELKKKIS